MLPVLVVVILAALAMPLLIRWSTRKPRGGEGLRWHAIKWQKPDADGLVERALAKQARGDLEGALADYDRALALGRSVLVLNNRGCALLESGQVARAIEDLKEAVLLAPADATSQCSLAEAYARAGDNALALESLKKAVALDPEWREYARTAPGFAGFRDSKEGSEWLAAS